MNKLHQILIVVLIIQIGLGVYIFWPQSSAATGSGPLLADFAAEEVVTLTISDNDGNRLVLAKNGAEWVLPEAGDFPADVEKITPVLDKLEGVQTNRLVTQTEASQARLQVAPDDFNRLLEIELQDGATHKLYLGSSAGASATHVRADDQAEVYLTGEVSAFDANVQASSWIDTLYFTVPQTATTALTLENENGTFEFEREGDSWTMKGLAEDETFSEISFTSFLDQILSVRMTEPIGTGVDDSAFENPQAVVTIETADQTYSLRVGEQDSEDNSYLFSASTSPYYVKVAQFTGDNIVNKTREEFLEVPPEVEGEEGSPEVE